MKAIVYREYGSPDVLRYEEIEDAAATDDEVLIKVRAASINPYDWHFMRGTPYGVRIVAGLRKSRATRLGADVAGQVEAVGKNITQFHPGDLWRERITSLDAAPPKRSLNVDTRENFITPLRT
jgi:NADPH:quinone reductase-like Zn-dependent oxidoreductase